MIKQFGEKKEGLEYKDRPGAYAVIIREDGMIGCVQSDRGDGLIFPGGGIDEGETPEVALAREVMEEMVRDIESLEFLAHANEYVIHPEKGPLNRTGHYYKVTLTPGVDGVGDRVTRWVSIDEFLANSIHKANDWIIHNFVLK